MVHPERAECGGAMAARLLVSGRQMPHPCRIRSFGPGRLIIETPSPLRCHQFVEVHFAQGTQINRAIKGMVIETQEQGDVAESQISFWPLDQDLSEARLP